MASGGSLLLSSVGAFYWTRTVSYRTVMSPGTDDVSQDSDAVEAKNFGQSGVMVLRGKKQYTDTDI